MEGISTRGKTAYFGLVPSMCTLQFHVGAQYITLHICTWQGSEVSYCMDNVNQNFSLQRLIITQCNTSPMNAYFKQLRRGPFESLNYSLLSTEHTEKAISWALKPLEHRTSCCAMDPLLLQHLPPTIHPPACSTHLCSMSQNVNGDGHIRTAMHCIPWAGIDHCF